MAKLYLRDDIAATWRGRDPFDVAFHTAGETYRAVKNRRTYAFEQGGRRFFAKVHGGIGWGEILKNLLTLRAPVLGADNEYRACRHLAARGLRVPTVAAFGRRGVDPSRRRSFVVCDALEDRISLEDVAAVWGPNPPAPAVKRAFVLAVADVARAMHAAGVNHRDFYICHLLADRGGLARGVPDLAVIDLHRAQIRARTPRRWLLRDLAALMFSSLGAGLTQRDRLRFVRRYSGRPLRETLGSDARLWQAVVRRARALEAKGVRESS